MLWPMSLLSQSMHFPYFWSPPYIVLLWYFSFHIKILYNMWKANLVWICWLNNEWLKCISHNATNSEMLLFTITQLQMGVDQFWTSIKTPPKTIWVGKRIQIHSDFNRKETQLLVHRSFSGKRSCGCKLVYLFQQNKSKLQT